jgi:hypothetical protein
MNLIRKVASMFVLAGVAGASIVTAEPTAQAYTQPGFIGSSDPGCIVERWNAGVQTCPGVHTFAIPMVDNDTNTRVPSAWVVASGYASAVSCRTQAVDPRGPVFGTQRSPFISANQADTPVQIVPAPNGVWMPGGWSLEMICTLDQNSSIQTVIW